MGVSVKKMSLRESCVAGSANIFERCGASSDASVALHAGKECYLFWKSETNLGCA